VDNNYLDLGMNKSRFVHTLPSGRFNFYHTNTIGKTSVEMIH
jgi:hypothetical protein